MGMSNYYKRKLPQPPPEPKEVPVEKKVVKKATTVKKVKK